MKKRILAVLLAAVLVVGVMPTAWAAGDAAPTQYAASVNGSSVVFPAYEVSGQVYVRLRDVAKVLNSFNVQWVDGSVVITTNAPYTSPVGSEMAAPFSGNQPYVQTPSPVTINGVTSDLSGILLTDAGENGYNYFTPQALEAALGIELSATSAPWATAYAEQVKALALDDPDLTYALIYVDEDEVPELVADQNGYYLSLYTYKDGEVKVLMDSMGYGISGNEGYTYTPRGNAVYGQYWFDDVSRELYMQIGQNGELEPKSDPISAGQTEDPFIEGNMTAEQILAALTSNKNP